MLNFTIVTLSFNQSRFLEQAICSVLNQNYQNIEYIVVDPGSTDGSRDVIEMYRNKITKIIYEPDIGPADGLNKGFSHATGDVYGYINADDILLPGTIEKVANYFAGNDIDVLSGHCYVINDNSNVLRRLYSHKFNLVRYCAGYCVLIQPSTFFKSTIFKKTKWFNPKNNISWDGEMFIDMALNGARFAVIQDYLSCFRFHSNSISCSREYIAVLNKESNKIKALLGYKEMSSLYKNYLWISGWILQPVTLFHRIVDGVKYKLQKLKLVGT